MSSIRVVSLLEMEPELKGKVAGYFEDEGYCVRSFDGVIPFLEFLKNNPVSLALVGLSEKSEKDVLKLIVRQSPMASVILMTDLSETDVHEMAEGYGILGAVPRSEPVPALKELKDRFEEISGILESSLKSLPLAD